MFENEKIKLLLSKYKLKEYKMGKNNQKLCGDNNTEVYDYLFSNFNKLEELLITETRANIEKDLYKSCYVPMDLEKNKIICILHLIGLLYGIIDVELTILTNKVEICYDLNDKMGFLLTNEDLQNLSSVKKNLKNALFDLISDKDQKICEEIITIEKFNSTKEQIKDNDEKNHQKNAFLESYLFGHNRASFVDVNEFIVNFDFIVNKLFNTTKTINNDKKLIRELTDK